MTVGNPLHYELEVNGVAYAVTAPADTNLLTAIRSIIGLTGTKEGCDDCECGACMVLLDGRPVNSCSYLAAQAQGRAVTTIEGVAGGAAGAGGPHALQQAVLDTGGVQCGFCTPGMILSALALLDERPDPTQDEVRMALAGNLCRCTGYAGIVAGVLEAAAELRRPAR